jgi:hypothetical protein
MMKRDPSALRNGNLDTILTFFQTAMGETDDRIAKLALGKISPRGRDRKYEQLDDRLASAISEYEVYVIHMVYVINKYIFIFVCIDRG